MGRSVNTGALTVVLYEDPPDGVPKIHVRSRKYMAWIAENNLPVHMHAERVSDEQSYHENTLTFWLLVRVKLSSLTSGG